MIQLKPKHRQKIRERGKSRERSPIASPINFPEIAYQRGGEYFLSQVRDYGCNEKGKPLVISRWYEESLLLVGDLRIHHTLTTGPAQIGKTLSHTLLMCWLICEGKVNSGWFYATRDSRELNVPEQFRPVIESWIELVAQKTKRHLSQAGDRHLNSRYQVDGATAIFSYVSTSRSTPSRSGLAKAGGAAVSFTANLLVYEERSQWPPGCADPLPRRLDASCLPTKPIRELGTPGAGQGIEAELKLADRHFYPHYTCSSCGQTLPLDPKGCLLRPTVRRNALGQTEKAYLSESGRPVIWWHSDPNNAVDSAYFGCSSCGQPIPESDRLNSWMQDLITGITAQEFIKQLPQGVPDKQWRIGVHFSPLCRKSETNLAAEIISSGLQVLDTTDWQQQRLGHPSENQITGLTQEILSRSIGLSAPPAPTFVLAGVDCGRAEDWLFIVAFYIPDNYLELTIPQICEQSARKVLFGSDVVRTDIPELLERFGVQYGLIDNEPDRESSMEVCSKTVLEMADQKVDSKEVVRLDTVEDGGIEYPCWFIRSNKFLGSVLSGFLLQAFDEMPSYRLPAEWEKWKGNPSDRSPLVHLTGPSRDPVTGKWQRGARNVDDLYYAAMFCEAAFYIKLMQGLPGTQELVVGEKRGIYRELAGF